MDHKLFKPKSLEEGKHAVVGDCNGIPMAQRYEVETPLFAKRIIELSKKADVAHPQILDYGCGVGRLANEILKEDGMCDVRGVDASSEMIDLSYKNVESSRFLACLPEQLKE
jgi:2-polyprenyl-3-methyl-5-hydroxy-6-metoxy-1,4-benzoquinol methylase